MPLNEQQSAVACDVAFRLQECRRRAGLTQKEAAERSGVHEKTISSYECGSRAGTIKMVHLIPLLEAYGIDFAEFFSAKTIDDAFMEQLGGKRIAELVRRIGRLRDPWCESALRAVTKLVAEAEAAQKRCGVSGPRQRQWTRTHAQS
jgi:transcriptional regulator with XRE-family HTH domain